MAIEVPYVEPMAEELTLSLTMRISATDKLALDRLAARHPMLKPLTIARFAFRCGMAVVDADPTVLYQSDEGIASVRDRLAAGARVLSSESHGALDAHQDKKRTKAKR